MRPFVFSQEDQAELLEAAGLDPEALAALPPEMRREVLEQVWLRWRLLRLPGGRVEKVEYMLSIRSLFFQYYYYLVILVRRVLWAL